MYLTYGQFRSPSTGFNGCRNGRRGAVGAIVHCTGGKRNEEPVLNGGTKVACISLDATDLRWRLANINRASIVRIAVVLCRDAEGGARASDSVGVSNRRTEVSGPLSGWNQARVAKACDQRVEKTQVRTAASHELRTGDGSEDCASLGLTFAFRQ
jgi:hypothetical protein